KAAGRPAGNADARQAGSCPGAGVRPHWPAGHSACRRRSIAGAVMSGRIRRMAARLWPDSLFRRLAIILFAGLLAAHVLSFALVALNVFGPSDELSDYYFMKWVATAVAILDRVKPEERPAWLDRLGRPTYRYVLKDGGEVFEPRGRRWEVSLAGLRADLEA